MIYNGVKSFEYCNVIISVPLEVVSYWSRRSFFLIPAFFVFRVLYFMGCLIIKKKKKKKKNLLRERNSFHGNFTILKNYNMKISLICVMKFYNESRL